KTPPPETYPLSLHDALPIFAKRSADRAPTEPRSQNEAPIKSSTITKSPLPAPDRGSNQTQNLFNKFSDCIFQCKLKLIYHLITGLIVPAERLLHKSDHTVLIFSDQSDIEI